MAITMFITKFHPKVCSHIPDRSLIPDILLWNTNSSEMNIPAKLAKNIAKTASRNIFIILFWEECSVPIMTHCVLTFYYLMTTFFTLEKEPYTVLPFTFR